jgi:hypothetical protein
MRKGRISKMPNENWVFWLNVTNIALGVVVLLATAVVAYGVVWELVIKRRKVRSLAHVDAEMQTMLQNEFPHHLAVPELGLTMADGGEQVKPENNEPTDDKNDK